MADVEVKLRAIPVAAPLLLERVLEVGGADVGERTVALGDVARPLDLLFAASMSVGSGSDKSSRSCVSSNIR